ncbi:MAG TPA: tryptophan--tRNA ligase [Kofleriaceae bacterium]
MPPRVLTGIKPTGTPHIGNLLGAIRPALELANQGLEAMYFIADYHALTTVHPPDYKPDDLRQLTYEVAATWLAAGLDPERTLFYRQSDIPEIFELAWVFSCFTSKGWANKSHAYKDHVAKAQEAGETDVDAGINMGVYSYPILMAADIVAFDVDLVPVGKDQQQHVEIARDIAQRINHAYGKDVLKLPKAKIDDNTAVVPGIDGKKMSKSYGNVIPIFASPKQMKKAVNQIVTDSLPPETPKDPDASTIFAIYKAIATPDETRELADRYRAGIGWGDAKKALLDRIEAEVGAARTRYDELMADTAKIDALLAKGAEKARVTARATLDRVRKAIGISR